MVAWGYTFVSQANGILQKTGENTRVGRQIRFANLRQIAEMKTVLKAYIYQAIEVEKAGLKVNTKEKIPLKIPVELQEKLKENPDLKKAFNALTPGRQRAYSIYFSTPKQSTTRESRIKKSIRQILNGKGLNDR